MNIPIDLLFKKRRLFVNWSLKISYLYKSVKILLKKLEVTRTENIPFFFEFDELIYCSLCDYNFNETLQDEVKIKLNKGFCDKMV